MGAGDWNDGMNRVGNLGTGESVWVGWFLHKALGDFLEYCDESEVLLFKNHMGELKAAIEKNAWDGAWYRRAYFDDGTPLGSSENPECRIDSLTQTWSVLSGAGDLERSKRAMAAVDELLVHRGDGLIKLFTPPFERGVEDSVDPGYIRGYLPGVRENGGQYTHAAIWCVMAFAQLGDGERASELFSLLNPINHSSSRAGLHRYKVEPYVVAADVYGIFPHAGRGGWTWYTGSSSWMYRAALESILGLELRGNVLKLNPKIPSSWDKFEITYHHGKTRYKIQVVNGAHPAPQSAAHQGRALEIELVDDGQDHTISFSLEKDAPPIKQNQPPISPSV